MSELPYEERLYFLLWSTHARATPLADHALAEHAGMTRAMLGMLQGVALAPGVTSADIVRRLPVTQQGVSQLAARLEERGWLERRLVGGRRVGLYLTRAGHRALATATASDLRFESELAHILGKRRYEQLRELLLEAGRALAAAEPEAASPRRARPAVGLRADGARAQGDAKRAERPDKSGRLMK